MLGPIDLQVVIVKGVDSAQATSYSQQFMASAQQTTAFENEIKSEKDARRVTHRQDFGDDPSGSTTDSNGHAYDLNSNLSKKREADHINDDPYRGKVIDIRL